MSQFQFAGFTRSSWSRVASVVRLKRVPGNKGFLLRRKGLELDLQTHLDMVGEDGTLIIGYVSPEFAIARALFDCSDPRPALENWKRECAHTFKAVRKSPDRVILFNCDAAATNLKEFSTRLGLRTGLEFASQKRVQLFVPNILDLDLAGRITDVDSETLQLRVDLDRVALLPTNDVEPMSAEALVQAALNDRAERQEIVDGLELLNSGLTAAIDNIDQSCEVRRELRSSTLLQRNEEFWKISSALQRLLEVQEEQVERLRRVEISALETQSKAHVRLGDAENVSDEQHLVDSQIEVTEGIANIIKLAYGENCLNEQKLTVLEEILEATSKVEAGAPQELVEPSAEVGVAEARLKQARLSPRALIRALRDYWLLSKSGLFDRKWYLSENPDVAALMLDPLLHYLLFGGEEGRAASQLFCSAKYLQHNEDVRVASLNPLTHYLRTGKEEGRHIYRPSS